ncbi:hypothetical protein MKW92_027281 [Papaver armeniacum]|nr:hypothetical protein MKW92_027281 [Papaver armeniacum]
MDDSGQHGNGRHRHESCKQFHPQFMLPPQLMKDDQARIMKFMSILSDRDTAIRERNLAISEKDAALAERDLAIMQRNAAISERNNAVMERDNAFAALKYKLKSSVIGSSVSPACPSEFDIARGTTYMHQIQHMQQNPMAKASYNPRQMHIHDNTSLSAVLPKASYSPRQMHMHIHDNTSLSAVLPESPKPGPGGRPVENKLISSSEMTASKPPSRKRAKREGEGATVANTYEQYMCGNGSGEEEEDQQWTKLEQRGLKQVNFDASNMLPPVCSCTGALQQCYRWGKGGWQSACCTKTLSVYPLPVMDNKRSSRIGGRKMSGGAFTKLVSRLTAEGHDLSLPLDLKDHWSRHGTNRYSTIK